MALTEEQAAKIVLVRSVEESYWEAFSPDSLTDAVKHAGPDIQGAAWLLQRSSYLIDRLPGRFRSILHLARLPGPWSLPVSLVALIVGFATNLLGPAEKIHVVRNPVAFFVGWNLCVYLGLLFFFFRKKLPRPDLVRLRPGEENVPRDDADSRPERPRRIPWILESLLPGLWKLIHAASFRYRQTRAFAETATCFWSRWLEVAGPLVVARWQRLLHFSAIALAAGATLGMYFRGLFQGYDVLWASTYIRSEESVAALIGVLFGPAFIVARLAGADLREQVDVTRLLSPAGDPAGPWIHLFAITVVLAVVLPRAILAAWQEMKIRRLQNDLPLVLDRYYGDLLASPISALIEQEVRKGLAQLAEQVADFVGTELYDRQIVPQLERFRENGGRIADLRLEVRRATEAFAPAIESFIAAQAAADFERRVAAGVEKIVTGLESDFHSAMASQELAAKVRIEAPSRSADAIGLAYGEAVSAAIAVSIAAGLGTISGGFGETLGIAIVTALLGTTGPVGFLIGAVIGIVSAGAAWWFGREKITEFVESIDLPAAVVRPTLWESRFRKLVADGRVQCCESVKAGIAAQTDPLVSRITEEILVGVHRLWKT